MQLELNRSSDLAVEALLALRRAGGTLPGGVLADEIGATAVYLRRVMKPLRESRWVESLTGPSGGYTLLVTLDQISLLDLIEACEGSITEELGAPDDHQHADGEACVLGSAWRRAATRFVDELASTTVADLV